MKKLFGFTLAELLIALTIIGVLSAAAVSIIKPYEKGVKYVYSNVFHTLDRAYLNAIEDYLPDVGDDENPFGMDLIGNEDADTIAAYRLCKLLGYYITTIEDVENGEGCSADKVVGNTGDDLTDDKIQFITVSGIRFYISRRYSVQDEDYDSIKYFLVFADTNGDRGPNTVAFSDGVDPDIFAFVLLNDPPRALPIGIAEINPKYLLTRIAYATQGMGEEEEKDGDVKFRTDSYPYYITKARAWGYYLEGKCTEDSIIQRKNKADVSVPGAIEGEPFSYNDIIRADIEAQSSADNIITSPVHGRLSYSGNIDSGVSSRQPIPCSCTDADTCWVNVDRYAF